MRFLRKLYERQESRGLLPVHREKKKPADVKKDRKKLRKGEENLRLGQ